MYKRLYILLGKAEYSELSERGMEFPTELIPDLPAPRLFFDMSAFPTFALKHWL